MREVTDIRPIRGEILLSVPPPAAENVGGIIVPAAQGRGGFREAWVRALPRGYRGDLCVGERVLLPAYQGREVVVNKETLVFVPEALVAAVLG